MSPDYRYGAKEIHYINYNPFRFLVNPLVSITSPTVRAFTSRISVFFDGVFSKIFRVMPDSSESEIGYIQSAGFPTIIINGAEFPYIRLHGLTKASLERSGLYYKDHWWYKFWHSPVNQFNLLRRANEVAEGTMVEPVAMVLDINDVPTGYIMKKARGRPLAELIKSRTLSVSDATKAEESLIRKINRLHANGIGHGDLNKENIFLDSALEAELIDPMETLKPAKAIRVDTSWIKYLHKAFDRYRR